MEEEEVLEIRCINCNRLFGRIIGVTLESEVDIEMKCIKCKLVHVYKIGGKK